MRTRPRLRSRRAIPCGWLGLALVLLHGAPARCAPAGPELRGNHRISNAAVRLLVGDVRDSTGAALAMETLLARYRELGLWNARVEWLWGGPVSGAPVALRIEEGEVARLTGVRIVGLDSADSLQLADLMAAGLERQVDAASVEGDLALALDWCAESGFPFAAVRAADFQQQGSGVLWTLVVDRGPGALLRGFRVAGATRTSPERVVRQAGLKAGRPFRLSEVRHAQWKLQQLGAFDRVVMHVEPGTEGAWMRYEVQEGGTSTAEGLLGYDSQSGGLTGFLTLDLQNLGGGRAFRFRLAAHGRGVNEYQLAYREPLVAGTPITLSGTLTHLLQDTLYTRTRWGLEGSAELFPYAVVALGGQWERVVGNLGELASDGVFQAHGSLTWDRRDAPLAPTRGGMVKLRSGFGKRVRSFRDGRLEENHSEREDAANLEWYLPRGASRVLALALQAHAVRAGVRPAPEYALLPLGGARFLRGYREEQFRGTAVGVATVEWRWITQGQGYVFMFGELGFLRREWLKPDGGVGVLDRGLPALGMGVRVPSRLGMLGLDYAWGDRFTPLGGKVHVSLRSRF